MLFDLHTHTDFSDGQMTLEENIREAERKGLALVAITDHFGEPLNHRLSQSDLIRQKKELEQVKTDSRLRIVHGIEVGVHTYVPDHIVMQIDLIIRSVHYAKEELTRATRLFDKKYWEEYKERVLEALDAPCDVLGHVEGYLPLPVDRKTTTFDDRRILEREVANMFFDAAFQDEVARKAAQNGVAIELHCGSRTPRLQFIERCVRAGCLFSVGSDAHRPEDMGNVGWAFDIIKQFDIEKTRLLPFFKGWLS